MEAALSEIPVDGRFIDVDDYIRNEATTCGNHSVDTCTTTEAAYFADIEPPESTTADAAATREMAPICPIPLLGLEPTDDMQDDTCGDKQADPTNVDDTTHPTTTETEVDSVNDVETNGIPRVIYIRTMKSPDISADTLALSTAFTSRQGLAPFGRLFANAPTDDHESRHQRTLVDL